MKFELIWLDPNVGKKPWWAFSGNFGPFDNIGLSQLNTNFGGKKETSRLNSKFRKKICTIFPAVKHVFNAQTLT